MNLNKEKLNILLNAEIPRKTYRISSQRRKWK